MVEPKVKAKVESNVHNQWLSVFESESKARVSKHSSFVSPCEYIKRGISLGGHLCDGHMSIAVRGESVFFQLEEFCVCPCSCQSLGLSPSLETHPHPV